MDNRYGGSIDKNQQEIMYLKDPDWYMGGFEEGVGGFLNIRLQKQNHYENKCILEHYIILVFYMIF